MHLAIVLVLAMMPPELPSVERTPHQAAFIACAERCRTASFFGGLQAGKSIAGADALRHLLYETRIALPAQVRGHLHPEVWILSRSHDLALMAWQYFVWRAGEVVYSPEECRELGLERGDAHTHWLRPMDREDKLPIRARVRTAHDPEQLRATGVVLAAWADECSHWRERAWMNLQGRGIVTPTRYLVTTTPNGKTWSYRELYRDAARYVPTSWTDDGEVSVQVEAGRATDLGTVTCRSADNPWADPAYLERLRRTFGASYAEQELDALFVDSVGLVYSFDRDRDMVRLPSTDAGYYDLVVLGVDPGYGSAYAVTAWGRRGGAWFGLQEFKRVKVTTDDIIPMLREWCARWNVRAAFVDKRRPTDYLLLRKAGIPAQANVELYGETETRTVMPMVRFVAGLIRDRRLCISDAMEETALEFESYHFPEREDLSAGENPVKYMDDLMDSMRYAICSVEPYLPIRDMQVSERRADGSWRLPSERSSRATWKVPTVEESLRAEDERLEKLKEAGWEPGA